MKVYIKPWEEALKCAKEFDERLDEGTLVNTFNGVDYILGVMNRYGDWGRIVEAKKCSSDIFDYYVTYYHDEESFSYPDCCVEEITPDWLEKNAEVFSEKEIIIPSDNWCNDKHRIVIYKCRNHLDTFFFYVEWFYLDAYDPMLAGWQVEKFMEIN